MHYLFKKIDWIKIIISLCVISSLMFILFVGISLPQIDFSRIDIAKVMSSLLSLVAALASFLVMYFVYQEFKLQRDIKTLNFVGETLRQQMKYNVCISRVKEDLLEIYLAQSPLVGFELAQGIETNLNKISDENDSAMLEDTLNEGYGKILDARVEANKNKYKNKYMSLLLVYLEAMRLLKSKYEIQLSNCSDDGRGASLYVSDESKMEKCLKVMIGHINALNKEISRISKS